MYVLLDKIFNICFFSDFAKACDLHVKIFIHLINGKTCRFECYVLCNGENMFIFICKRVRENTSISYTFEEEKNDRIRDRFCYSIVSSLEDRFQLKNI